MALAASDRASAWSGPSDWPIRLRLKGLQGEHAEFNGDYVREHRRLPGLPHILASWRLESGSSVLYLEQAACLIRFARTVSDVEHRRWFLSAKMSGPPYACRQSLWAGNLSDWMLQEEPVQKICLRPIMGRWENLAPDLGMSERPVARQDQAAVRRRTLRWLNLSRTGRTRLMLGPSDLDTTVLRSKFPILQRETAHTSQSQHTRPCSVKMQVIH